MRSVVGATLLAASHADSESCLWITPNEEEVLTEQRVYYALNAPSASGLYARVGEHPPARPACPALGSSHALWACRTRLHHRRNPSKPPPPVTHLTSPPCTRCLQACRVHLYSGLRRP